MFVTFVNVDFLFYKTRRSIKWGSYLWSIKTVPLKYIILCRPAELYRLWSLC